MTPRQVGCDSLEIPFSPEVPYDEQQTTQLISQLNHFRHTREVAMMMKREADKNIKEIGQVLLAREIR